MSRCLMPQGHPGRCGCVPMQQPILNSWNGIRVMVNDFLPAQTMMVSRDIYEQLKREVPGKDGA